MLVLSRKVGEQILIGQGIRVTVVAQEGGRVRLGIEAPNHVPIVRREVAFFGSDEPAGRAIGRTARTI